MIKKGLAHNRLPLFLGILLSIIALFVIVYFLVISDRPPAGAVVVPRDFATLEIALQHVLPGDTVVLQPGREPIQGPVLLETSNVNIVGSGQRTIIESKNGQAAIRIAANNIKMRGIVVKSSTIGVMIEQASNITLEDIVIARAQIGIYVSQSNGNLLKSIKIANAETAIELETADHNTLTQIQIDSATEIGIRLSNSWSNSINNLSVTEAKVGISLEEGSEGNELAGCKLHGCANSGVEILSSSSNVLRNSKCHSCGTGILLSAATGNTIENNRIEESTKSGIELYKSHQNGLFINTITKGAKDGISVSNSQENSISHNFVEECSGTGISLGSARSNLILDNSINGNAIGIQGIEAVRNRILRNKLSRNLLAGLVLSEGEGNLLLDNYVSNGAYGVALIESKKNEMLRNHFRDISAEGVSLLNRADENFIKDNIIDNANISILVAASSDTIILDNYLGRSEIAVNLFEPGTGTRLEGNDIVKNSIGVQVTSELEADDTILQGSGSELVTGDKEFRLILTSNTFASNNLYDISNLTNNTLYVGTNYWKNGPGKSKGQVSAGVVMPSSTWKGTVALGTTNSIDHIIIGRLLQLGLTAKGIKVIDLIGLGNEETLQEALIAGDINLALAEPNCVHTDTLSANQIVVSSSLAVENRLTLVISESLAIGLVENTITDLASLLEANEKHLELVVEENISNDQVELLSSQYGIELTNDRINWTDGIDQTETELKLGSGNAGMVNSIEESLTMMGFQALEDNKNVLPVSHMAFLAPEELLDSLPEIKSVEEQLRLTLTTENVHSLVTKVRLLHSDPAETARQFMLEHELIAQ